ncbi:hypothetical protein PIB30_040703 [Stylosanthes scabra]|uniref:Uncharacterized protein n=1 Tax=Stylosanthes scabra TaxID=79078 RepID=A0ABU6SEL0_9FABA|nr:hypothetical protein [Stylosanthes scabra]
MRMSRDLKGNLDLIKEIEQRKSGIVFRVDGTPAKEQPPNSDSDCDWEEGIVKGKNTFIPRNNKVEWNSSVAEGDNNDESEVELEEGDCDGDGSTLCCPSESG